MVRFRKSMGFVSKNVAMGLPPIIDSISSCPTCGSARSAQTLLYSATEVQR